MHAERYHADAPSVVLITGAAGGLGLALTRLILQRGGIVIGFDLDTSAFAALDGPCEAGRIDAEDVDITDARAVDAAVERAIRRHGRIDVVVNNAGISQISPFSQVSDEVMRKVMDVNFFGAVNVTRATLPALRRARGMLVALSSVAGFAPLVRRTAYAASKHAMQGFFASLRSEERANGVGVLVVCPSFVSTNPSAATFEDGTSRPGSAADGIDPMSPEVAAAGILGAIDARLEIQMIGKVARASWWINRLSPRLYARLMERSIRKRGGR